MTCSWKDNWETAKKHFIGWWKHDDLILCGTALPLAAPGEPVADPGEAPDIAYFYTQPEWKARWNHHRLAHQTFPAEVLPVANTDIGPGSLALYMGGEAVLADDTVWYKPIIDPDDLGAARRSASILRAPGRRSKRRRLTRARSRLGTTTRSAAPISSRTSTSSRLSAIRSRC